MIHEWRMRGMLRAFHEETLPGAARTRNAAHVECCPRCATELQRLRRTDTLLGTSRPPAATLSPAVSQAIQQRALIESGVLRRRTRGRRLAMGGLVAGALFAATATVSLGWKRPAVVGQRAGGAIIERVEQPFPERASAMASGAASALDAAPKDSGPIAVAPGKARITPPRRSARRGRARMPLRVAAFSRRTRYGFARRGAVVAAGADPARQPSVQLASRVEDGSASSTLAEAPEPATPAVRPDTAVGQLLVLVTTAPPEVPITVRQAAPETPGYARAASVRQDPTGTLVRSECTVSSEKDGWKLVLSALPQGEAPR